MSNTTFSFPWRDMSWRLGEVLSCYYGPMLILSILVYFLTQSYLFLGISIFYLLVFIVRWMIFKGSALCALGGVSISSTQPETLILADGLQADLYLHTNLKAPCLIFFYGGGFIAGEIKQYASLNSKWLRMGFHVLQVPYSFLPEANFDKSFQELKARVEGILEIKRYDFAPKYFMLGGRSAGGYMAYAVSTQVLDKRIRGVIGFYPPVDPQSWKDQWPAREVLPLQNIYQEFFADTKIESNLLKILNFPTFRRYYLLTGTWDLLVSREHSRLLKKHLINLNCQVDLLQLPGEMHGYDCNPHSFAAQKSFLWLYEKIFASPV